ncbi:MAG: serine protease [Candidatus Poribacteria bacterium]|nr:serine protease [Candidatus Poribacteria bacterium]
MERDLVILKVAGVGPTILPWGNSDDVQVGDAVYVVGNPRGWQGTFSDGIISSIRKDTAGKVLQMAAPISPGSSGGPVLNNSGKVVGISFSFIRDGQNINFAIPSNPLRALLTKSANLKPLFQAKFEGVSWIRNPLVWNGTATYTFSFQNKHRWAIKNVHCLVLFSDQLQRHVGFDIVKVPDPIPAGATKNITRRSIFDIPQLQNLDFNGWNVADRIAFLIASIIHSGQNLSDYNIIDPAAKNPAGSYEVRIIDYELLI